MLQRHATRKRQDFVINSGIAADQQIRNGLTPYTSLFPQVPAANGVDSTQNFNALRYAGIRLPTVIPRNRQGDLTSKLGPFIPTESKTCSCEVSIAALP